MRCMVCMICMHAWGATITSKRVSSIIRRHEHEATRKNHGVQAKDIHRKEPGSTKVPRVIYHSSDNTGLSEYSLSSIILKRTHLSVISRINRVRLSSPKRPPHHVLIGQGWCNRVLRFLASRALRLKATTLLKWLDQFYHPQGGLHQVNDLKSNLVRNTPSKSILLPFSYLKLPWSGYRIANGTPKQ